ncbi:MAG: hypothetical protein HZA92_00690 [Verrucomicrobia bacterium]|nr:hypothetical protein [Verrucomicrobiota bacterium]
MNTHQITKSLLIVASAALISLLAGCASTSTPTAASYLSTPSRARLSIPVYFSIQDQRAPVERQGDPSGFYLYTVDNADPNRAAQALGVDICRLMERKGITTRARVALPGEVPPADGIVVHLSLASWFGRLPTRATITEKTVGALLGQPIYAEGRCRFSSTATYSGQTSDLGVAEGSSTLQVSRQATITKEGNAATAVAADTAIAQFLQAFERQFAR